MSSSNQNATGQIAEIVLSNREKRLERFVSTILYIRSVKIEKTCINREDWVCEKSGKKGISANVKLPQLHYI